MEQKSNIVQMGNVKPVSVNSSMQLTPPRPDGYNGSGGENMPDMEKYYDLIREDMKAAEERAQASEERTRAERREAEARAEAREKAAEARTNKLIDDMRAESRERSRQIDERFERMESKIDANNKYILGISISTILGIAAMVVAVFLAVKK